MTLIEIMVALAVTSFLLIGLFTIVQTMLLVSNNQSSVSQLQDNERLAMTRMGDVIQQAGYFTAPTTHIRPVACCAPTSVAIGTQTVTFAADQAIFGMHAATPAPQDTITVRYYAGSTDNLVNCDGTISVPVGIIYNTFAIDANGNLTCRLSTVIGGVTIIGNPVILVAGIKDMVILYGVNTSGISSNPVDSYITASSMAGGELEQRPLCAHLAGIQQSAVQRDRAREPAVSATEAFHTDFAGHRCHGSRRGELHMTQQNFFGPRRQAGVVLVMSLLLLLVITLLALSMFRSVGMQEMIAGSLREKDRALQSAVSAQQYGEWWLTNGNNINNTVTCTPGPLNANLNQGYVCTNTVVQAGATSVTTVPWIGAGGVEIGTTYTPPTMLATGSTGGAAFNTFWLPPRFYIQLLGASPAGNGNIYQVDAWGYGGDPNTVVVVESTYLVSTGVTPLG